MSIINQETYDQFERYHRGQLSFEDQQSFESRLNEDNALKIEYDQFQKEQLLIKELAKSKLKEKAKTILSNAENDVSIHSQSSIKWKPWVAIAALVSAIAISSLICLKPTEKIPPQQLYASHFELLQPSFQRSSSGGESLFNKAMDFYVEGNYDQAIAALSSLDTEENDEMAIFLDRKNLFLGLSYMVKNEHSHAIAALKSVSQESIHYDDAIWYEALSTLQLGRIDEAKVILEKLASKNHYKSKDAENILENL